MTFTDSQLKAIKYWEKPIMVLATAGSGKTHVLTQRINYAIRELNIAADNILAITFTNKATNEMRAKIFNRIVTISTIHSLCVNILRNDIENINNSKFTKDFEILSDDDQLEIIKTVIASNNIKTNLSNRFIKNAFNDHINSCYELTDEVKEIFVHYLTYIEKFNVIAFDDILYYTLKLLSNPFVLMKYQERFKYIFVDEFQDVNLIQYKIIKLLASE